jgi:signal peptidase I
MSATSRFRNRYLSLRETPVGEAVETVCLAVVLSFILRLFILQAFYIPSRSMETTLAPFDHIVADKFLCRLFRPSRGAIVIFDLAAREDAGYPWNPAASPARAEAPEQSGLLAEMLDHDASERREYVKRVIGRGGDRIAFEKGQLLINGAATHEPYLASGAPSGQIGEEFALRVPGRRVSRSNDGILIDGRPLAVALPSWIPPTAVEDLSPANFCALRDGVIGIRRIVVPDGYLYLLGDNRLESADSRYFGLVPETAVKGRALMTYWPPRRLRLL